jgi:hypothetical protein
MLVYIKTTQMKEMLQEVGNEVIPVHIKDQFERARLAEEEKKKNSENAHLYTYIQVWILLGCELSASGCCE